MILMERKITKEIYERALKNRGYIDKQDSDKVFTISELCGYGVYGDQVFEKDGDYFVRFERGDSCD